MKSTLFPPLPILVALTLSTGSLRAADSLPPTEVAAKVARLESSLRTLETNLLAALDAAKARLEGSKSETTKREAEAGVLRTREIQLVDPEGRVRMILGTLPNGAVGLFAPNSSAPQVVLGITPAGEPVLELTDSKTSHRATLVAEPGKAGLVLISQGRTSADLHVTRDSGIMGISMPEAGSVGALQVAAERAGLTVARSGQQVIVAGSSDGAGLYATGKGPDGSLNSMATLSLMKGQGAGIDLRDDQGRRNGLTTLP